MTFKQLGISLILCTGVLLAACDNKQPAPEKDIQPEDKIMQELASAPVKDFVKTEHDQHDIALLGDYDTRFTQMSDDMEDELARMQAAGTLTGEFAYKRKRDNVRSALAMLKELDLKTEQGRFIQGLMANYWENQAKVVEQHKNDTEIDQLNAEERVKGLGDFIQAQEQLEHWRSQYPETAEK